MKGFYAQANPEQKVSKTANTNFLGMTYQRTFQVPHRAT